MKLKRYYQNALSASSFYIALSLLTSLVHAQDFTLFETVETTTNTDRAQQRGERGSRVTVATAPDFTLVGTARIGNSFKAVLAHRDGSSVTVDAPPIAARQLPVIASLPWWI